MEDDPKKYHCPGCGETVSSIYACYTTNEWLCFQCLVMADKIYAKAIHSGEMKLKREKERE